MRNTALLLGLGVAVAIILGLATAGAITGNYWRLLLLLGLWPLGQAAREAWHRRQMVHGAPPDVRGERPTDPNELARGIVEQSTDKDSAGESNNNQN